MLTIIIIVLASMRLLTLIRLEDGPFYIFSIIRNKIGLRPIDELPEELRYAHNYDYYIKYRNVLSEAVSCIWCLSVWTSTLAVVLSINPITHYIVVILAVSEIIKQLDMRGWLDG